VEPVTSQKITVTVFLTSRGCGPGASSAAPQELQKRAPAGFSCPHAEQRAMR